MEAEELQEAGINRATTTDHQPVSPFGLAGFFVILLQNFYHKAASPTSIIVSSTSSIIGWWMKGSVPAIHTFFQRCLGFANTAW